MISATKIFAKSQLNKVGPFCLSIVVIIVCFAVSWLLRELLVSVVPSKEVLKLIAGLLGYFGGMVAFVPRIVGALLNYRKAALTSLVAGEPKLKPIFEKYENYAKGLDLRYQSFYVIGFAMVTLAFLLTF